MTDDRGPGGWPLAELLGELAHRRGLRPRLDAVGGGVQLHWDDGTRPVPLPTGRPLGDAVLGAALATVAAGIAPVPYGLDATVLRPAGGLCGPARHGPVDAVRDGGVADGHRLALGLRAACRLLDVQHTRCWLAALTFTGPEPARFAAGEDMLLLPAVVAADTARISQYMIDSGAGFWWETVALAGPPVAGPDGRLTVLAAFTEAHYVRDLVRLAGRDAAA